VYVMDIIGNTLSALEIVLFIWFSALATEEARQLIFDIKIFSSIGMVDGEL